MADAVNPWLPLASDDTLWPVAISDRASREKILLQFAQGEIAVTTDTSEGSAVFFTVTHGGKKFLVPHRHLELLKFFLRATPGAGGATQQDALSILAEHRHLLLTGGPGTGKSYTLSAFVAALKPIAGRAPRIAIAAPTGKAAARYKHLENATHALVECSTLHRLLGLSQDERFFRYNAANPLPCDVLVIDEISMLDLGLFSAAVRALPETAQLVLAGDGEQLPAVDGLPMDGVIRFLSHEKLIDHVHLREVQRFSRAKADAYRRISALGMRALEEAAVAEIVKHARIKGAAELFDYADRYTRERICSKDATELRRAFSALSTEENPPAELVAAAFDLLKRQVILSERREGFAGSLSLNRRIAADVARITQTANRTLEPVMNTINNYELQLYNGDVGFIFETAATRHGIFATPEGGFRLVPLAGLKGAETAYAMTIHKSQGSEYENVSIVCAANAMNRLLYTAVTRAKGEATILELV